MKTDSYILVRPNKLPEKVETEDFNKMVKELLENGKACLLDDKEKARAWAFENLAIISLDKNSPYLNRILYHGFDRQSCRGVIHGDFIIVGIKGKRYRGLKKDEINELKLFFGRHSINSLMKLFKARVL
jgi:hypothetical protein